MFSQICLTLIASFVDKLTKPSLPMLDVGFTTHPMVLNRLLFTGSLDSIKSWGVGGHGFFGWHCISSDM